MADLPRRCTRVHATLRMVLPLPSDIQYIIDWDAASHDLTDDVMRNVISDATRRDDSYSYSYDYRLPIAIRRYAIDTVKRVYILKCRTICGFP